MLDWLASVQIRRRSQGRVELELTRATGWAGWALTGLGLWAAFAGAHWAGIAGMLMLGSGLFLATLRRTLVFDRGAGLLYSEQRMFGLRRRTAIPLFHLRAVVVAARRGGVYAAYVERRTGGTIHLDEARRPAALMALAEAVAEVADLRLIYDATTRIAAE